MPSEELLSQLKNLAASHLKARGLDLVEFSFRYEGRSLVLRLLADRPEGGITVDECAGINQELSSILDEQTLLSEGYILEVFSPGADRPLRLKSDFARCIGRRARFFLKEPLYSKIELEGQIKQVTDESVYLETELLGKVEIPLARINRAKQLL
jgi:ribosome maturation factor RimP